MALGRLLVATMDAVSTWEREPGEAGPESVWGFDPFVAGATWKEYPVRQRFDQRRIDRAGM